MSAGNQPIIIKKKKGGHGGGHHGGSWKVAYADFVTAMMAFFMVMWIMGLSEETRKSIQGYFNDPIGFMKNEARSKSVIALTQGVHGKPTKGDKAYELEQRAMESVEKKVKDEVAHGKGVDDLGKDVKVSITPDGLQIEFVEARGAVFFESGSAIVRPEARKIVARIAPLLASSGRSMVVEGHTDAAPCGSPGGNWGLSTSRAMALMEALRAGGCREDQFKQVAGYAATRLEKPEAPLDFSNRRVTILIPREAKEGTAPPAAELRDKIATQGDMQAIDLAPPAVDVHAEGKKE